MIGISLSSALQWAGQNTWLQAVAIVGGTFILEDATTILAAIDAASGGIAIWLALGSLYLGVVLGDLGLYGLGKLATSVPWLRRWVGEKRIRRGRAWLRKRPGRLIRVVFVSRFLPGMRLPTYTACGFVHAGFRQFAVGAILAVLVWTSILFGVSMKLGSLVLSLMGAWGWAALGGLLIVVMVAGRMLVGRRMPAGRKRSRGKPDGKVRFFRSGE